MVQLKTANANFQGIKIMAQTTCYILFGNLKLSQFAISLMQENHPHCRIRNCDSREFLQTTVLNQLRSNELENNTSFLFTDCHQAPEVVRTHGAYLPIVLLEQNTTPTLGTEFSPEQIVDFSNTELVLEAIQQAINSSTHYQSLKSRATRLGTLVERERKIIALASEGVPNKTIAVRLGISIKTVEKNRRNAYAKLAVSSTAEMASLVTFGRFIGTFA
ncbi:MAG: DNA-binding NarL/FixJ family response regulator [Mariniblastus sp.]